jgi:hypothetical protein
VDRTKTERMIALLHAQRGEAARRSGEVRGSARWADSSNRLETLNQQIMRLGSAPSDPAGPEPDTDPQARAGDPPG